MLEVGRPVQRAGTAFGTAGNFVGFVIAVVKLLASDGTIFAFYESIVDLGRFCSREVSLDKEVGLKRCWIGLVPNGLSPCLQYQIPLLSTGYVNQDWSVLGSREASTGSLHNLQFLLQVETQGLDSQMLV